MKKKNSKYIFKYWFSRVVYSKKLKKKFQSRIYLNHFFSFFFGIFKKKKLASFFNISCQQKNSTYLKLFNFFLLFESRLDRVFFRLKFGFNLLVIRQFIKNGFVFINTIKVVNPGFLLKVNDFVTLHKIFFNYLKKDLQLKKLLLKKYRVVYGGFIKYKKTLKQTYFKNKKDLIFLVNYSYYIFLIQKPFTFLSYDNKISRCDLNNFYLFLK